MSAPRHVLLIGFVLLAANMATGQPPPPTVSHPPDERLKVDLLLVAAHPDDESAVSAYLARAVLDDRRRAAAIYITAGRSDGNTHGSEAGFSYGAVREIEARGALGVLGITNSWFLRNDGQFSQNVLRSLGAWSHGAALEEVVRVMRLTRPEVVITWIPALLGDHGDHQAAGVVATEAFDLAGDPAAYPSQLRAGGGWSEGLSAWQPKKLYYFTDGPRLDLQALGPAYSITDRSRSRNLTYEALAAASAATHRSQEGFAQLAEAQEKGQDLGAALKHFETFYGFAAFPNPTRFLRARTCVGGQITGDLFEGTGAGPCAFNASRAAKPLPPEGVRFELGGPWGFYREFWPAHGVDHLARLRPPSVADRAGAVVSVPLVLTNATSTIRRLRVEATLPPGWKLEDFTPEVELAPHSERSVIARVATPKDGARGTESSVRWEATTDGRVVGDVELRIRLTGGGIPFE